MKRGVWMDAGLAGALVCLCCTTRSAPTPPPVASTQSTEVRSPGRDFDRPWQSRRGIETIDYNNGLILAKTTVDRLAAAIASRAESWERDVLGRRPTPLVTDITMPLTQMS
jgi:hypothetical protein